MLVTCAIEGIVTAAELAEAIAAPVEGAPPRQTLAADDPASLKKLREKHHSVARFIAQGMKQSLVASICGYTDGYLSVLLDNPAMQELVGFYRAQHGEAQMVVAEKLRTVGLAATDKLHEMLEDPQAELDVHGLIGIAKLGLDRSGHGPQSTRLNLNETRLIDEAELARINLEARRREAPRIVSPHDVRAALPAPQVPEEDKS